MSKYNHNPNGRGYSWVADEWYQVRHCEVCLEPMLLADYLLDGNCKKNKHGYRSSTVWTNRKTCCQECANAKQKIRYESKRQWFHRATFTRLVSDFREALGFPKSDTESTFGPWDLNMVDLVDDWRGLPEWDSILLYLRDLRVEERTMLMVPSGAKLEHVHYHNNNRSNVNAYLLGPKIRMTGRDKHGSSLFFTLFEKVYRDEFYNAPLWNLKEGTKRALRCRANVHWMHLPKKLLFARMKKEIYPNGLTFDDWVSLCSQKTYGELKEEYPWMPSASFLFYGTKTSVHIRENMSVEWYSGQYDKIWDFVLDFRNYMSRDDRGRFTKPEFRRIDCLVNQTRKYTGYNTFQIEWTMEDMREWFFSYLLEYYEVHVDRERFPYDSSEEELQNVINLRCTDIEKVKGYSRVYSKFSSGHLKSVRWLVSWLWPDYQMVQTRWNRMLLAEKQMSNMLDAALTHMGIESVYHEATSIPTENGKARYEHSEAPIKVDYRCEDLKFIVEGQGEYHYMQDEELLERMMDKGDYVTSLFWNNKIPDCYDGEETTLLGYRQFLDRKCKEAIEVNGYTPIYVILTDIGYAVDGVHGDIPVWNRRYVTDDGPKCRYKFGERHGIGLAETFDMQGRKDVGDMLRAYYYDVVKKRAAACS